jgi:hypothetical protein
MKVLIDDEALLNDYYVRRCNVKIRIDLSPPSS